MRGMSARLEDDFWDHEHLSKLNTSIAYAQEAWHNLRDCKAEQLHAAENLGNLYMTRYNYLGRPGDLDDALRFCTMEIIFSSYNTSKFPTRYCTKQAARLSLWSSFADQPDEMDDSIEFMDLAIQDRSWERENCGVNENEGSGYSVALGIFSRIYRHAFIRRRGRPDVGEYLRKGVSHCRNACRGTLAIDPGRLITLTDSARAHLQLYLAGPSLPILNQAIQYAISTLDLSAEILARNGIHRRYNKISATSISAHVVTDNDLSLHTEFSLKERRFQRWIVEALEICGDLLLARYQRERIPQDLETAIITLKLSVQGTHGWSPRRSQMLFRLNQALRERLRTIGGVDHRRLRNLLHRSSKTKTSVGRLGELCVSTRIESAIRREVFAPLIRNQCTRSVIDLQPVKARSWLPTVSRGAYDRDMQLSVDLPNFLTSDMLVSSEWIQRLHYRLDPRIDVLLNQLDANDVETESIRSRWDQLYCRGAASLYRADVYQRALLLLIKKGDTETACKLSDLVAPTLGHLELFLMEPELYLSNMMHASNLATTVACVWLHYGRDPWDALAAVENGRELASRDGMNTVRSYGFDGARELLPQVLLVRDQLQKPTRSSHSDKDFSRDQFVRRSNDFVMLLKELAHSEACLVPFGRKRCVREARNGAIVHLITSDLGTYALITTSDDIQKVKLSHCTREKLVVHATAFRKAVAVCQNQETYMGAANKKLRSMLEWLWKTVVKPIVQCLRLKMSSEYSSSLPSIRWIACGIFSQLPIHAAGIYSGDASDFMDQYAVSSYLSSIRATVAMQHRKPLVPFYQNANREFTLFGMSTSPQVPEGRLADLAVEEEKRRIFASLGPSFTNNAVTDCNIGMVRNMMYWARIIHFSCHGLPHPTDPSQSRLVLLHDEKEPFTVAAIRNMDVPNALLLFLSACHSASDPRGAESDEITHVAKAFLLAGFPTVIGTLWQAYQASALDVAAEFYAHVAQEWKLEQEEPEEDLFPRALHRAVWKWREGRNWWKPMDWASWVCFR